MTCQIETPLCIVQGDDKAYNLTFTQDGTTPLDLTDSTLKLVIVGTKKKDDADALVTKTITTFTDATNGLAAITLTNTDTDLPIGTYFYRLKMIDSIGKVKTVMRGELEIVWAK